MDIVIFVKSCRRDWEAGIHDVIRSTWGTWSELVDIRFVMGRGPVYMLPDEVQFEIPDGYDYLWEKTREANLWARDHNYKYAFHVCTDTYVVVPRLLQLCNKCTTPYTGAATSDGHLSGGTGYLLNRAAMHALAESKWHPKWEDQEVYELLDHKGIRPTALDCFRGKEPVPWDTETVSVHLGTSTGSLTPNMIRACDRRFVEAFGDAC